MYFPKETAVRCSVSKHAAVPHHHCCSAVYCRTAPRCCTAHTCSSPAATSHLIQLWAAPPAALLLIDHAGRSAVSAYSPDHRQPPPATAVVKKGLCKCLGSVGCNSKGPLGPLGVRMVSGWSWLNDPWVSPGTATALTTASAAQGCQDIASST